MLRWILAGVFVLICFPLSAQDGAVRRAIEDQNTRLMNDINRQKDGHGVASMYMADSILLPPNEPAVKGIQNVRQYWLEAMKVLSDFRIVTKDVFVHGKVAYEVGEYAVNVKLPDDKTVREVGKYIVIWKRQSDGIWRNAYDIWNTNTRL